jgi:HAD superfamily hydrolase (TIGR01549 family)
MKQIKAIGFDLFNTLIAAEPQAFDEAMGRLVRSLKENGVPVEPEAFRGAHRQAALHFLDKARQGGRETHNRFWISAALKTLGHRIPPQDRRIADAVNAYFSAFFDYCQPIPGTLQMLESLKGRYRLGLLSNFTHPPAAQEILERVGLMPFFDVILISGALGYRKPHPLVFQRLIDQFAVGKDEILFIGDDPEPDIEGARKAGIRPVWMTYVRDRGLAVMPRFIPATAESPDTQVPRISTWDDLHSLLGRG